MFLTYIIKSNLILKNIFVKCKIDFRNHKTGNPNAKNPITFIMGQTVS